ncbi:MULTISPECIES: HNH/ENDO VII family nuclease [Nocardia]|uniref:HNH/ENDO VII family nuclease n=1 Tax=Nocardia thailandica TaxID=257275 RepID=A0ABW6PYU4_9NOCA|nr:HNH/ENDO VII family nuclease [Nocardia neocaledoniensis]
MAPVIVTPTEIRTAATVFKNAHGLASAKIRAMAANLQQYGGCAGSDKPGRDWSASFDPAAKDAMTAAAAWVSGLAQMHDLLEVTATNHANANQLSVIGGADTDLAFGAGSLAWMQPITLPALFGGSSEAPSWWDKIAEYTQGEVWPSGNPENLRNVATQWSFYGDELLPYHSFQAARDAISGQQTPEVQQILDQITILENQGKTLTAQFKILAKSCADYALAIENTRKEILTLLGEFAAVFVIGEVVSWGLASYSFGLTAAGGTAALAARAAVVGSRIATLCRNLATTAQMTGLPVVAASGAFARSVAELSPLLAAQAGLATAEATGAINPLTLDDLRLLSRTRPYLRVTTTRPVQEAAPKVTVNGQEFYLSATDPTVLIPVSGKYADPAIRQLPMDARNEYYLGANGMKYPVNSTPVMGHEAGHEFWRLREEALRQNMTWAEFRDYVNNPSFYRIEDAPGNSRHIYEAPR